MPDPIPPMNTDESKIQPAQAPSGAQADTALKERPRLVPARVEFLPQFRVLLHNDDVNSRDDAIDAIVELTVLDRPRAVTVVHEADTTGVALVLVTHKERAELYREQFKSKRLTVTIEPAA